MTDINSLHMTLEAITKTANEVKEMLAKSMPPPPPAPMAKEEDEPEMPPEGAAPESEGEGNETQPPVDEAAHDGAEQQAGQSEVDEFAQEIKSMSDEELDAILQALAAELELRQGQQQQQPGQETPPPPAANEPPPPPAPNPEMEAMKSENACMKKSIQVLQTEIAKLKKSVIPVKPAAMNKPNVTVAHKEPQMAEMLTKSEVLTHLETLKKSGNKAVDVDLVWSANRANDKESMQAVYEEAKLKGITLPRK